MICSSFSTNTTNDMDNTGDDDCYNLECEGYEAPQEATGSCGLHQTKQNGCFWPPREKMDIDSMMDFMGGLFPTWNYVHNLAQLSGGRILLLWNPQADDVDIFKTEK